MSYNILQKSVNNEIQKCGNNEKADLIHSCSLITTLRGFGTLVKLSHHLLFEKIFDTLGHLPHFRLCQNRRHRQTNTRVRYFFR